MSEFEDLKSVSLKTTRTTRLPPDINITTDISSIQPLTIQTERELESEFDALREVLKDKVGDWKKRCDSLKRLQTIASGNAVEFESFVPLLHTMKEALAMQLGELRSSIVREACTTINILAKVMRDGFEQFGDYFIPCLFKLVVVTIQIISDSGNHCIRTIIKHTKLTKSIPLVLESAVSKKTHGSLRTKCAEYMLLFLDETPLNQLERYADQFVVSVQGCLSDSLPNVRSAARQCYWLINRHWPDRAAKLYTALDPTTQRHIGRDEPKAALQEESSNRIRSKTTAASSKRSGVSSIKKRILAHKLPVKTDNFIMGNQSLENNNDDRSGQVDIGISSTTIWNQKVVTQNLSPTATPGNPPQYHLSTAPVRAKGVARPIPNKTQANVHHGLIDETSTSHRAWITQNPDMMAIDTRGNTFESNPIPAMNSAGPTTAFISPEFPRKANTRSNSLPNQTDNQDNMDIISDEPTFIVDQSLFSIMREVTSQDWNIRMKSLEGLLVFCKSDRKNELISQFEKVMNMLLEKVSDTHYRVVNRALQCLHCFISEFQQQFEPFLERVFSKILLKLTDSKEKVRKLTENVLLEIGNNYTGEALLPVLFKVIDNSNSKVQLACLEYILHIVPNSITYLSYPSHMRIAITKINTLLSSRKSGKACEAAAVALLLSLYRTHSRLFLEQVLLLSINEQLNLKQHLETKIPDFEYEIANISKQRSGRRSSNGATNIQSKQPTPDYLKERSIEHDGAIDITNRVSQHASVPNEPVTMAGNDGLLMIPSRILEKIQKRSTIHSSHSPVLSTTYNPEMFERKYGIQEFRKNTNSAVDEVTNIMNQIHYNSSVSRAYEEACKNIRHLTELIKRQEHRDKFQSNFAKLLFKILELIHHEDAGLRASALYMLQALLEHNFSQFESYADITLKKVMAKYTDIVPEVFRAAVEVSETFASKVDPLRTIEVLKSLIVSYQLGSNDHGGVGTDPREAILLGSIKLLSKLVASSRVTENCLNALAPSILPGLADSMSHPNADIRKAVVYLLVDMFDKLGPAFGVKLGTCLTDSQIKLVTVYLKERKNRTMQ